MVFSKVFVFCLVDNQLRRAQSGSMLYLATDLRYEEEDKTMKGKRKNQQG